MSFVKIGVDVIAAICSRNKIVSAFSQLEESAILHVKAYLAKLGINEWAVDYTQTPYSMYNSAMRMCAIDTFRFLIAGTYYYFLRPNTSYAKDTALLVRLYDHFIHHYMYDKWKTEIRTPGGNEIIATRNKISQNRLRVCYQLCFNRLPLIFIFPALCIARRVHERREDAQETQAHVPPQGYL
jgi:hypothetical protein